MKVLDSSIVIYEGGYFLKQLPYEKGVKGKRNLPFRSVKVLKMVNSTGFVNHLHSKCSEFTVVKREANFTTRHVKRVPFVERRNTSSV